MKTFAVVLVAAGQSSRFRARRSGLDRSLTDKKPFALLKGRAVWLHAAQKFAHCRDVKQIILVVAPEDLDEVQSRFAADLSFMSIAVVAGGSERFQSVQNALKCLEAKVDFVAIHDAVRPCLTTALIDNVFDTAVKYGAALPAAPVVDTLKKTIAEQATEKTELARLQESFGFSPSNAGDSSVRSVLQETVDRRDLWEAQTPQVFRRDWILEAYANPTGNITDDAQLVERLGKKVVVVPSDRLNLKITTQNDLLLAEKILEIQTRKSHSVFDNFH